MATRRPNRLFFHHGNGHSSPRDRTTSTSHDGFDNDVAIMDSVLETILGKSRARRPFTKESLRY